MAKLGIIGGSGLYDIEGLEKRQWIEVNTPFGNPSDEFLTAEFKGKEVVFLPRHGRHHTISPTEINYRANIYGMKYLGVSRIVSVTACGSLKEEIKPLDFIVISQFIDRTNKFRESTFFEGGIVAHISLADPICKDLAGFVLSGAEKAGVNVHSGGTYINMEGPQFSTLAESNLYRSWGADVIGMTNLTEAKLAREAEICYAALAAVTDYDCWRKPEENVSVDMVLENLRKNVDNSKRIVKEVISGFDSSFECACNRALEYSIVTRPEFIPGEVKRKLNLIIGKYI